MTASSPTIVDRFMSMSVKAKLLPTKGGCPSTVSITVPAAAAPAASLSFLFWGAGLFVLPVIGVYTAVIYWMFRGKQHRGYTR